LTESRPGGRHFFCIGQAIIEQEGRLDCCDPGAVQISPQFSLHFHFFFRGSPDPFGATLESNLSNHGGMGGSRKNGIFVLRRYLEPPPCPQSLRAICSNVTGKFYDRPRDYMAPQVVLFLAWTTGFMEFLRSSELQGTNSIPPNLENFRGQELVLWTNPKMGAPQNRNPRKPVPGLSQKEGISLLFQFCGVARRCAERESFGLLQKLARTTDFA